MSMLSCHDEWTPLKFNFICGFLHVLQKCINIGYGKNRKKNLPEFGFGPF